MNPDSRAQLFPAHLQFGKTTQIASGFHGADGMCRLINRRAPGCEHRVTDVLDDCTFVLENTACRLLKVGGEDF